MKIFSFSIMGYIFSIQFTTIFNQWRCSIKRFFFKFCNIQTKAPCQGLCFNKVALSAWNFSKKETQTMTQAFSWENCELFRNTSITEALWANASEFLLTCLTSLLILEKLINKPIWVSVIFVVYFSKNFVKILVSHDKKVISFLISIWCRSKQYVLHFQDLL